MAERRNRLGHVRDFNFEILSLRLKSHDAIGGTFRLRLELAQALLELLLERIQGKVDHSRLQNPAGQSGKELIFKTILTDQDTVRAHATNFMAGATILYIAPATIAGNNRHP